jgi:hypothetical protein
MGAMLKAYIILVWKSNGRDHIRRLGVNGRIILKRILKKENMRVSSGFILLRRESTGGLL